MRYNLNVLNDKEFEGLAKDLLDRELGVQFEIYKSGRDGGIDLRYNKDLPNEIIVQVKHYINSKYADLVFQLKREKIKLEKLTDKPERYIVFTSLPLNTSQSDEIKAILDPYIKTTKDIFGGTLVEALISNHPEIEKKYFKLWLTSTNVMERILHNAVSGNSEFQATRIESRSKLYIHTSHIESAFEYLNDNKFLIISGEPGVGKTTLAYMLVYEMMGKGFKLIYSDRSIREAEDVLSNRADDKQVVFIDDFLGSNLHDIYNPANPENSIIRFIEQIKATANKYLIFTSRTTILSQANQRFENFKRANISDMSNYELKISAYTNLEKAKILYNHLYHAEISEEFKEVFFRNKNYLKIINHPNYYPRLIETLTKETNFEGSGFDSGEEYVFDSLDNPTKIWEAAFENQLTREDQLFLETLFTFGDQGIDAIILEEAFEHRISNEVKMGIGLTDINAFNNCLKKLQDVFLNSQRHAKTNGLRITFINPSVTDFFMDYLQTNHGERYRIWNSIVYIDQFEKTFGERKSALLAFREHEFEKYFLSFAENLEGFKTINDHDCLAFKTLDFLWRFFYKKLNNYQDLVLDLMQKLLVNGGKVETWRLSIILIDILIDEFKKVKQFVEEQWDEVIDIMVENIESPDDLQSIVDLHGDYKRDFNDFLADEYRRSSFETAVGNEFEAVLSDHDFDTQIDVEALEYYGEQHIKQRIDDKAFDLYLEFLDEWKISPYIDPEEVLYEIDTQRILDDYLFNLRNDMEERLTSVSNQSNTNTTILSENDEIERLFSR